MNILMMTNTFTPFVGGVEKSILAFTGQYRKLGHRVVIVAPEFENQPEREEDVIRVPAIPNFNGSNFSLQLPVPGFLANALGTFKPDVVHAHHPFLLGDTALRVAYTQDVPLVFTHHTLYEQYTHYLPFDSEGLKQFVVELAAGYADLCDQVFAPSQSMAEIVLGRGVRTPVEVVPTGIELSEYAASDRRKARSWLALPQDALVIGFVSRLAPEKNLEFLSESVARVLTAEPDAYFLVIGDGPEKEKVREIFFSRGLEERLRFAGVLEGCMLIDAYHAMDVFVFASKSETQGMVLVEAMAAGVPVVGIRAPGVQDVIEDDVNGRLVTEEDPKLFSHVIRSILKAPALRKKDLRLNALKTAGDYSIAACARKALQAYARLKTNSKREYPEGDEAWSGALRRIKAEIELLKNLSKATTIGISTEVVH